jgi:hypothetical protein
MEVDVGYNALMAMTYCWETSPMRNHAIDYLEKAKNSIGDIPNEFLQKMLEKVAEEIEKLSGDFIMPLSSENFSFHRNTEKLHYWLVQSASDNSRRNGKINKRGGIDREYVAQQLEISRQNLEKMVKDWEENINLKADLAGIPEQDRKGLFARFNRKKADEVYTVLKDELAMDAQGFQGRHIGEGEGFLASELLDGWGAIANGIVKGIAVNGAGFDL